jgi:hypothetical protein
VFSYLLRAIFFSKTEFYRRPPIPLFWRAIFTHKKIVKFSHFNRGSFFQTGQMCFAVISCFLTFIIALTETQQYGLRLVRSKNASWLGTMLVLHLIITCATEEICVLSEIYVVSEINLLSITLKATFRITLATQLKISNIMQHILMLLLSEIFYHVKAEFTCLNKLLNMCHHNLLIFLTYLNYFEKVT